MGKFDVFRFKQFNVSHKVAAQKVSTDSVLLGSWIEARENINNVLDIGAGCGVLSLMCAQRFPYARVHAVEIDGATAQECNDNFFASPWAERLMVETADFAQWEPHGAYDLILCNPPYFHGDVKSPGERRRQARHDDTLTVETVVERGARLLSLEGSIGIVYPAADYEKIEAVAQKCRLAIARRCKVFTVEDKPAQLVLVQLSHSLGKPTVDEELYLRTSSGAYTPEYISLTQDFYLFLH